MVTLKEQEFVNLALAAAREVGYTLKFDDDGIKAFAKIKNINMPDIRYMVKKGKIEINFNSEMPSNMSIKDIEKLDDEITRAKICAKIVNNLYNNTLAIRLENIKL